MGKEKDLLLTKAWYSKADGLFHVLHHDWMHRDDWAETTFDSLEAFYRFCFQTRCHHREIIFRADLIETPYEILSALDKKKLFVPEILVSTEVQKKYKRFDASFDANMRNVPPSFSLDSFDKKSMVPATYAGKVTEVHPDILEQEAVVFYISDLHLDWKIARYFKDGVNEAEIRKYFQTIADRFKDEMSCNSGTYLIIMGDVSFNFEVVKLFLSVLTRTIYRRVFFVMGNHEYWDESLWKGRTTIDEVIAYAREQLLHADTYLLENDLAFPYKRPDDEIKPIYTEAELNEMSDEAIRELFRYSGVGIFGGTGFAGANDQINAEDKIYLSSPITREEEIIRSRRIESLHERLKHIVPKDKSMVVATHMPVTDWTGLAMKEGWYYISGHTHQNRRLEENGYHFLEDNQVGYDGENYHLKFFLINGCSDIFADRPDGQYEISKRDYELFNANLWLSGGINRDFEKIIMLKNSGNYMFFAISPEGLLYILDGGRIRSSCGHNIDYFYDNMANYSKSISLFLRDYTEAQRSLSAEVQRIGGRGSIHGCIIDLDPPGTPFAYNHLYLNPFDGSITPYFAESMTDKYIYSNIASLLQVRLPSLYDRFLIGTKKSSALIPSGSDQTTTTDTTLVINTDIYRVSRLIKSMQYTLNYGVIRLWNFGLADVASAQNGMLLLKGLFDPDSVTVPKVKPYRIHDDPNPNKPKKIREAAPVDSDRPPSFGEMKKMFLRNAKRTCEEQTGGTTRIAAISNSLMVECHCNLCGYIWNTDIGKANYKCPNCHGNSNE